MTSNTRFRSHFAALMTASVVLVAPPVAARDEQRVALDLPAQPLAQSLRDLATASGRTVLADNDVVAGKAAPAVRGSYTVAEALSLLLTGSGLDAIEAGNAYAVRSAKPGEPQDPQILVTGTRIRGQAPAGAHVITLDRTAIEQSGLATTQAIMASIPQNFGGGPNEGTVGFTQRNGASGNIGYGASVNLRGLGTNSTLTLIDGNRVALGGAGGTFVDLSLIPASAIERIEVLADGASAIYGSDAVAGVVNVRLRRNFEGAETAVHSGFANGFSEFQVSQIVGKKWATGHIMAAYEYYGRGRLGSEDRAYATEDLRPFGGPDYRQPYANPGTIIAADGSTYGIPKGQNGTNLTASELIPGVTNLGDGRSQTDLLPETQRHAGVIAFEQEITPTITLRLLGVAADRHSNLRTFALNSPVTVPTSNAFYVDPIGTGQPVTAEYDFRNDLGAPLDKSHVTNWVTSGSLEAKLGQWRGELSGSYSSEREQLDSINLVNYARLGVALADSNPATAFNVFGDGSHTAQSTIDMVRGSVLQTNRSRQTAAALKFDGPLLALPGGPLRLAVGGEYRNEWVGFNETDDDYTLTPVDAGTAGFPLSRNVFAGYAELLAPLVGPGQGITGIHRLDVSIAGRVEHYSDFGTTTNPKVGVTWAPVSDLALRGSYGTSFRAPGFTDVRQGQGFTQYVPLPLSDPSSPTGTSNAVALFGNNPAIGPERARTFTAGFDLHPSGIPGLALSATWFNISYRNRIYNPAVDVFNFLTQPARFASLITAAPSASTIAGYYASPYFFNPYGIPASGVTYVVDARNANLAGEHLEGIDFDLGFHRPLKHGSAELGVSGTWLQHMDQQTTADAPRISIVGTIGNPVRLRMRGRAIAQIGDFGLAAFLNYTAGYSNNAVAPTEPVSSWTTVDLQISHALGSIGGPLKNTKLSVTVTNLFNRAPPYVNNPTPYSASGFDPEQASAVGRMVALQLVKAW